MVDTKTADTASVDPSEIARFEAIAAEWWDPHGKFRPLHKFNPVRLRWLKRNVCAHFDRDTDAADSFSGLRFLDIGCGGGLLSEPMARLGADVVGADPSPVNVQVARLHAEHSGLAIDYRAETAESLGEAGETFDVVLNMEVVEHVADVKAFIDSCSRMVRPGGLMAVATINRTFKAWALAIVGAERILRWLPRGTHSYEKLVTPEELEQALVAGGLAVTERCGVAYNPLTDQWGETADLDVNYMVLASRPAST